VDIAASPESPVGVAPQIPTMRDRRRETQHDEASGEWAYNILLNRSEE
jgi:hypothetical protein